MFDAPPNRVFAPTDRAVWKQAGGGVWCETGGAGDFPLWTVCQVCQGNEAKGTESLAKRGETGMCASFNDT